MATSPPASGLTDRIAEALPRPGQPMTPAVPIFIGLGVLVSGFALLSDHPEYAIGFLAGIIVFIASGLSLELLMAGLLVNVMMGSARLFESPLFNLNRILGVMILLGLLLKVFLIQAQRFNLHRLTITTAVFGFGVFASCIFAQHQGYAFPTLRTYIRVFILFVLLSNLVTSRGWLRAYLLFACAGGAVMGVLGFIKNYDVHAGRSGGLNALGDFNQFGLMLATLVPFTIWGMRREPSVPLRVLHFIVFCGLTVGLVGTGSRGAYLGLMAAIGVLIIAGAISRLLVIPGLAVLFIGLALSGATILERFTNVLEIFTSDRSNMSVDAINAMNRIDYIRAGIPMFLSHPITGVGLNNFQAQYLDYLPEDARMRIPRDAHNTWLKVLAEMGVVGFIPFALLFFWSFQGAWRLHRQTRPWLHHGEPNPNADPLVSDIAICTVAALASYCVAGTFVVAQSMDIIWVLFGLVAALTWRPLPAAPDAAKTAHS